MEFYRDDQKKMIQIWLTKAESQDEALRERLAPLYTEKKKKKYIVAVYHSGKENLFECTLALLVYNKKRCAELAVQRAREQKTTAVAQPEYEAR